MAITSVGYDGPVDEVGFAQMIPAVGSSKYGVVDAGDWKVSAHPSTPQAVNVAAGKGWGPGVFDTSDSVVTVQCDTVAAGVVRWDLIVASRNWQPINGTTVFSALRGGTLPDIPSSRKTTPGVEDEQPIALVKWVGGQTQPQEIRDLRVWAGSGGLFTKDDLTRQYLTQIGTVVNVNGRDWALRLGPNDIPYWYKSTEPFAKAKGNAPIGVLQPGAQTAALKQTFPSDAGFTVPPLVEVGTDQTRVTAVAANVTTTGFDLYMANWTDKQSGNGWVRWDAEQMTPTSAAG